LVQIHYDNPSRTPSKSYCEIKFESSDDLSFNLDRMDSSGIRFYLGKTLRQYDLGYLSLGTQATMSAIAIPPRADRFIIDTYCPASATSVSSI
jgi:hypothetical protein